MTRKNRRPDPDGYVWLVSVSKQANASVASLAAFCRNNNIPLYTFFGYGNSKFLTISDSEVLCEKLKRPLGQS